MRDREFQGQNCAVGEPCEKVIRTAEEWNALWKSCVGAAAPPADFSRQFAVAVFVGLQSTGGYGVEFLEPQTGNAACVVSYRLIRPGPGAFVTQAFTQPYAVRLFDRTAGAIQVSEVP